MTQSKLSDWMHVALDEARVAATSGEVPVGAVVVHQGKIIAQAHNEVEAAHDATLHAEMLALRRAASVLGRWRLDDCSLFVTLEPCPMCIGAMVLARVQSLYFGAYDPRLGAVGSLFDLSAHPSFPHKIEVYPGLLADTAQELLKNFFAECRKERS